MWDWLPADLTGRSLWGAACSCPSLRLGCSPFGGAVQILQISASFTHSNTLAWTILISFASPQGVILDLQTGVALLHEPPAQVQQHLASQYQAIGLGLAALVGMWGPLAQDEVVEVVWQILPGGFAAMLGILFPLVYECYQVVGEVFHVCLALLSGYIVLDTVQEMSQDAINSLVSSHRHFKSGNSFHQRPDKWTDIFTHILLIVFLSFTEEAIDCLPNALQAITVILLDLIPHFTATSTCILLPAPRIQVIIFALMFGLHMRIQCRIAEIGFTAGAGKISVMVIFLCSSHFFLIFAGFG